MNINQNNKYGNNIVNIGQEQRVMDNNFKQQLLQMLDRNEKMSVNAPIGDAEAATLAYEIKDFLESEGYDVNGVTLCAWGPPLVGIVIVNKLIEGVRKINVGHNQ